jgi:hypothetical protein
LLAVNSASRASVLTAVGQIDGEDTVLNDGDLNRPYELQNALGGRTHCPTCASIHAKHYERQSHHTAPSGAAEIYFAPMLALPSADRGVTSGRFSGDHVS